MSTLRFVVTLLLAIPFAGLLKSALAEPPLQVVIAEVREEMNQRSATPADAKVAMSRRISAAA